MCSCESYDVCRFYGQRYINYSTFKLSADVIFPHSRKIMCACPFFTNHIHGIYCNFANKLAAIGNMLRQACLFALVSTIFAHYYCIKDIA